MLATDGLEGVVLRYGGFYGPGTSAGDGGFMLDDLRRRRFPIIGAKPPRRLPVWVARLAAGEHGVVLMTEVRGAPNAKARRELGWTPAWPSWRQGFRSGLGLSPRTSAGAA